MIRFVLVLYLGNNYLAITFASKVHPIDAIVDTFAKYASFPPLQSPDASEQDQSA